MAIAQPCSALRPRSTFAILVTVAGLGGVAAIFLPFAWDTSPLDALGEEYLWPLGVPLLLAIPVAAASIRRHISGRLSSAECVLAYLSALTAACCFLFIYTGFVDNWDNPPSGLSEWLAFGFGLASLAAAAYLLWRNWRAGVPGAVNGIAAMQAVYVTVAGFCLIDFASLGLEVGGYLVLVTTLAYLAQIIAVSLAARPRTPAALAPSGV